MKTDAEIIEALGGVSAVARLCQVKQPAVSQWKRNGIPQGRRMFLQVLRPDLFAPAKKAA